MNNLRELYQETIFDHYRQPRNFGELSDANRKAEGFNPLCGDKIKLYLKVLDGVIHDAHFEGSGCAISTASASLMTENLKGKREAEALQMLDKFQSMVTNTAQTENPIKNDLGKLEVLAGVREFPQRIKCATLAWHTMKAALENTEDISEPVTTE
ncbi:zinc-dependent sulfurtransferase SufU [mine drainage metagenome]|uniref:Zinc-dependent sulfurtransferase SufU n=1 Tax=mine drainage metagenome TaxID=410659 RepID=A0A1J5SJY8_9ZZZZ